MSNEAKAWTLLHTLAADWCSSNRQARTLAEVFAEHDRRVSELLEANNREVERRRALQNGARRALGMLSEYVGWEHLKEALRAMLPDGLLAPEPWNPATAPGHTDMMVDPETLGPWLEANPLPPQPADWITSDEREALVRDLAAVMHEEYYKGGTSISRMASAAVAAGWRAGVEAAAQACWGRVNGGAFAAAIRALPYPAPEPQAEPADAHWCPQCDRGSEHQPAAAQPEPSGGGQPDEAVVARAQKIVAREWFPSEYLSRGLVNDLATTLLAEHARAVELKRERDEWRAGLHTCIEDRGRTLARAEAAERERDGWVEAQQEALAQADLNRADKETAQDRATAAEAALAEAWAEIARLREALGPFAKQAERFDEIPGVCSWAEDVELWQNRSYRCPLNVGDLRRARAALEAGHGR